MIVRTRKQDRFIDRLALAYANLLNEENYEVLAVLAPVLNALDRGEYHLAVFSATVSNLPKSFVDEIKETFKV
jgi:hypothetical protein